MEFKELVIKARTCRRYQQDKLVPMELLMEVIDTARLIPSASNAQPLRYALSTSLEMNARLYSLVGWAPAIDDWPGPEEGQRPVAYIAIAADKNCPVPPQTDAGIAIQTIQLALAEHGIGCCIFNHLDTEAIHAALGMPRYVNVLLAMSIGYPAKGEAVSIDELKKGQPYQYYRDEQGLHHVPKRLLKDIVVASFP